MPRLPRQAVVIGCLLLLGGASGWLLAERSEHRLIDAGFWFEPVTYASSNLGEPVTEGEMKIIERIARAELTQAFAGLRIRFSSRSDATYRVRVVQQLRDPRFRTNYGIAGESRAVPGFGGQGTLSFYFLASSAEGYAPDGAVLEIHRSPPAN